MFIVVLGCAEATTEAENGKTQNSESEASVQFDCEGLNVKLCEAWGIRKVKKKKKTNKKRGTKIANLGTLMVFRKKKK